VALKIFSAQYQDYEGETFPQLTVSSPYAYSWTLQTTLDSPFTGPINYTVDTSGLLGVLLVPGPADVQYDMYSPISPVFGAPKINGEVEVVTYTPSGSLVGPPVTVEELVGAFAYYGTYISAYTSLANYYLNSDYPNNAQDFNSVTNAGQQLLLGSQASTEASVVASAAQDALSNGDVQFYNLAQPLVQITSEWDTPIFYLNTGNGFQQVSISAFNFGVDLLNVNGAETTWKVKGTSGNVTVSSFTADGYAINNNNGGVTPYWFVRDSVINGELNPSATGTGTGRETSDDFNGGGTSDILLQSGTGTLADWIVQNGVATSSNVIGNPAPYGYSAVHSNYSQLALTGDFNGDGTTDILLGSNTGTLADWIVQNGLATSSNVIGNPATYGYLAIGTGDFNGDGTSDILLQNSSGTLADWIVQNGVAASSNVIGNPTAYGYHFIGTGDFNGDATTDVLLQNGSGTLADWIVQNGVATSSNVIGNPTAYGYHFVGTGDFNGDGTTDVLLQNGSGTLADWIVQNGVATSSNVIGNPTAYGYSFVGTGDYNGDGTADILLQNAAGNLADWTIKNGVGSGANVIGNPAPYGYQLA
jgi:hypothetical protein